MHILNLIAPSEDIAGGPCMLKLSSLWQSDTMQDQPCIVAHNNNNSGNHHNHHHHHRCHHEQYTADGVLMSKSGVR